MNSSCRCFGHDRENRTKPGNTVVSASASASNCMLSKTDAYLLWARIERCSKGAHSATTVQQRWWCAFRSHISALTTATPAKALTQNRGFKPHSCTRRREAGSLEEVFASAPPPHSCPPLPRPRFILLLLGAWVNVFPFPYWRTLVSFREKGGPTSGSLFLSVGPLIQNAGERNPATHSRAEADVEGQEPSPSVSLVLQNKNTRNTRSGDRRAHRAPKDPRKILVGAGKIIE